MGVSAGVPAPAKGDAPAGGAGAEPDKEAQALLKQGRERSEKKDFAGAEKLFRQALAKASHDPELLLELGWAQLQLGRLVEARKTTLAAIEHATRPGHYAASSYNLGRIAEAAGNDRIAAADYRRSLAWQKGPAPALADRLKAIDKRLQGAPTRLLGPYKSVDSMCPELAASEDRVRLDAAQLQSEPYECGACEFVCDDVRSFQIIDEGLPAPLAEVALFKSESRDNKPPRQRNHASPENYDEVFLNAAVRVGTDWYLAPALNAGPSWVERALSIVSLSVKPVGPRGARVVVIQFRSYQGTSNQFEDVEESVCVIGSGPSGRPTLLGPFMIGRSTGNFPYGELRCLSETETVTKRQWKFDRGSLVVTGETVEERRCSKKTQVTRALDERHPLSFP